MDKNQVGKLASAAVAAAVPMIAGAVLKSAQERMFKTAPKSSGNVQGRTRAQKSLAAYNAPVSANQYQPQMGFRTAAPVSKGASARFVGCDYVGTINSSGTANTFLDTVFQVTPKNTSLFPRLGSIAAVFELYKFLKMRPIAVGKQASTVPGCMTLAPDLYPNGSTFTASEMRNEEGQNTCKYWEVCRMNYPCSRGTREWFLTDNANSAAITDAKLGDLHFGTDGTATVSQPVADLFIEYDIEFAQGQTNDGIDLMTPAVRRLLQYEGGQAAFQRLARYLLPEEDRQKFDEQGMLIVKKEEKPHSTAIDRLLRGDTPSEIRVQEPIPAAALRTEKRSALY
jgi:hypothetical protein